LNPCVVIPVYDHGSEIEALLESLEPLGLPCIVVDDGSHEETKKVLDRMVDRFPWVRLERLPRNEGKGAALKAGYASAGERGHTHILQLDADGQHRVDDLLEIWEAARGRPEALILGCPAFEDAPRSRFYGRLISRFWVHVETCSRKIGDPLCGLRCMPLDSTLRVLAETDCGNHMEFDPELAVRMAWAGVPIVNVPCIVRYPAGGASHFDMLRDNARISWMHTRLFLGMIPRLPWLLWSGGKANDRRG
jgi:glycosyltransferase involved in cell wall biosynthesis